MAGVGANDEAWNCVSFAQWMSQTGIRTRLLLHFLGHGGGRVVVELEVSWSWRRTFSIEWCVASLSKFQALSASGSGAREALVAGLHLWLHEHYLFGYVEIIASTLRK